MNQALVKTDKNAYVILLKSFNKFFFHQSRILLKEIKTIKYATNYYREFEPYYENIKNLNTELVELEIIYDGIRYIEMKVERLLLQFDDNQNKYNEDKMEEIDFLFEEIDKINDNEFIKKIKNIFNKFDKKKNIYLMK